MFKKQRDGLFGVCVYENRRGFFQILNKIKFGCVQSSLGKSQVAHSLVKRSEKTLKGLSHVRYGAWNPQIKDRSDDPYNSTPGLVLQFPALPGRDCPQPPH